MIANNILSHHTFGEPAGIRSWNTRVQTNDAWMSVRGSAAIFERGHLWLSTWMTIVKARHVSTNAQFIKFFMPEYRSLTAWNSGRQSVKASFKFSDSIKNVNISEKFILSLDFSSLFMNIPILESVQSLCKHIQDLQIEFCLQVNDLKEILSRCTLYVQCGHSLWNRRWTTQ